MAPWAMAHITLAGMGPCPHTSQSLGAQLEWGAGGVLGWVLLQWLGWEV